MPNAEIIDVGLTKDARELLQRLLDKHGINWFLARDGERLLALEKGKIDLVVRTAIKSRERRQVKVVKAAVEHARKQVRRELIRHLALAMVGTGA